MNWLIFEDCFFDKVLIWFPYGMKLWTKTKMCLLSVCIAWGYNIMSAISKLLVWGNLILLLTNSIQLFVKHLQLSVYKTADVSLVAYYLEQPCMFLVLNTSTKASTSFVRMTLVYFKCNCLLLLEVLCTENLTSGEVIYLHKVEPVHTHAVYALSSLLSNKRPFYRRKKHFNIRNWLFTKSASNSHNVVKISQYKRMWNTTQRFDVE